MKQKPRFELAYPDEIERGTANTQLRELFENPGQAYEHLSEQELQDRQVNRDHYDQIRQYFDARMNYAILNAIVPVAHEQTLEEETLGEQLDIDDIKERRAQLETLKSYILNDKTQKDIENELEISQDVIDAVLDASKSQDQVLKSLKKSHMQAMRNRIMQEAIDFVEAKERSETDELTGAQTKRSLEKNFNKKIEELKQPENKDNVVIIIEFDIDHFKNINDQYGHHNGDLILKKIVQSLRKSLRKSDDIGRPGGDELTIIATVNKNNIQTFLDKFKEAISAISFTPKDNDDNPLEEHPLEIVVTGGYTVIKSNDKTTYLKASEQADQGSVHGKIHGRGELHNYADLKEPEFANTQEREEFAKRVISRFFSRKQKELELELNRVKKDTDEEKLLKREMNLLKLVIEMEAGRYSIELQRRQKEKTT